MANPMPLKCDSQNLVSRIPSLFFRASSNIFESIEEMFVNLLEQKVVVAVVDVDSDQNRSWHFECLAEHRTDLVRGIGVQDLDRYRQTRMCLPTQFHLDEKSAIRSDLVRIQLQSKTDHFHSRFSELSQVRPLAR
jgi:hypothetical protein